MLTTNQLLWKISNAQRGKSTVKFLEIHFENLEQILKILKLCVSCCAATQEAVLRSCLRCCNNVGHLWTLLFTILPPKDYCTSAHSCYRRKKWRIIFGNLNFTNYFRNIPCQCKPSFCKNDSCRYHFRHSFYSPWQCFSTHIVLPEHWQLWRISWRRCMFIGGGGKAERDRKQRRQDSSKDYLLTQAANQVEENLK